MSSIEKKLNDFQKLQALQQRPHWMNKLHPLGKLFVSVLYIFTVVSVGKYDLSRLILLAIYPVFGFVIGELSLRQGIYRMRLILPLVIFVGIFNPFFDREILLTLNGIGISGGMISMITLMIKGIFSVLAVYILIATTSIEEICYALRCIHVPKIIVIVILLIDRYFYIMGQEADRIFNAYRLRAPKQKGIHYSAWGTLVGMWLIRCMDRAEIVYESMLLRGFKGDFNTDKKVLRSIDFIYPVVWIIIFVVIRNLIRL